MCSLTLCYARAQCMIAGGCCGALDQGLTNQHGQTLRLATLHRTVHREHQLDAWDFTSPDRRTYSCTPSDYVVLLRVPRWLRGWLGLVLLWPLGPGSTGCLRRARGLGWALAQDRCSQVWVASRMPCAARSSDARYSRVKARACKTVRTTSAVQETATAITRTRPVCINYHYSRHLSLRFFA